MSDTVPGFAIVGKVADFEPGKGRMVVIATGTMVQDPRVGVSRHEVRLQGDEIAVRLID